MAEYFLQRLGFCTSFYAFAAVSKLISENIIVISW